MNRKMTPVLLSIALAIGLITYVSERSSSSSTPEQTARHGSGLQLSDPADVIQVRVKRDFWNSLTLQRGADGAWQITEPFTEPASNKTVDHLLATLSNLPVLATIDLPADDSERHREYGLWEPSLELTVTTSERDRTLVFGTSTPDGTGTYCASLPPQTGDKIFVISAEAVKVISGEPASYRTGAAASPEAPAPHPAGPVPHPSHPSPK